MILKEVYRNGISSFGNPTSTESRICVRQVIATAGTVSSSLWEAPDVYSVEQWLNEKVGSLCKSECIAVEEDHSTGLDLHLLSRRKDEVG